MHRTSLFVFLAVWRTLIDLSHDVLGFQPGNVTLTRNVLVQVSDELICHDSRFVC